MKNILKNLNYPLLLLMIIYSIFGLIMIFSASSIAAVLRYDVPTNYFFIRQLIFLIFGYIVGIAVLFFPTSSYRYFSKIAMWVMIFLLAVIFIYGSVSNGAQSWYEIGFLNFQPTEFVKVILIIYLAVYYNKISKKRKISLINMLYPLIFATLAFVLIALQPDFGGAFIIFGISALIFFSLPIAKKKKRTIYKVLLVAGILGVLTLLVAGKNIFQSYQISRILNFTNPCQRYSDDTGYQVCNGYIAIHNGGLTGVGLGESTQKYLYLPEAHTDFIFPIICEELGLIVGIVVVFGYFVILFLILFVAKDTDNLRNSILAYGIFAYLLMHILINLLGVLGLIPLTGVPLPFLSYGGSYNLCVIVSLFIVQRINIENKDAKLKKKIEEI